MLHRFKSLLSNQDMASRAKRGSMLTVVGFGGNNLIRLISNLALTRLLFPEAFGLMAIVSVVMSAVEMFSDIGIRASVVQSKRGDDPDFINTAWTLQVMRGVVLSIVVALLATPMANFYDQPMLAQILPVAGLGAFIAGFIPSRVMTAGRNMHLGRLTVINLCTQALNVSLIVLMAWWLESVWALVFGALVGAGLRNISIRLFMEGQPDRFRLDPSAAKELISFGKFIFISTVATFAVQHGDRAILAKFISIVDLSLYSIAYFLASVPLLLSGKLANQIVFPLYSRRLPHENAQHRARIFRARFLLTGLLFLSSLPFILGGSWLIEALYDPRYHEAGNILPLLSIGFMVPMIVTTYPSILLANGKSGRYAVLVIIDAALRIMAIYFGVVWYGVAGVALAPAVAAILAYPAMVALTHQFKAWDPRHDAVFFILAGLVVWGTLTLYPELISNALTF